MVAVIVTFAVLFTIPGLGLMYAFQPDKTAAMNPGERLIISAGITSGIVVASYFTYKVLHGLHDASTDIGMSILDWIESWQERRKRG